MAQSMGRGVVWMAACVGAVVVVSGAGCSQKRAISMVTADANRAYYQGRYQEALVDYQEIVDRKPYSAQAHYDLGRTLLKLDRGTAAREQMEIAYNLEPRNDTYINGLADAMRESGRVDEGYAFLKNLAAERNAPEDYIRLGNYALKIGNPDEARQAFISAAVVDGGQHVEPQLALAEFYESIGDKPNEVQRLKMVLYIDPFNRTASERLRELGEVPGPGIAIVPEEQS